MAMKAINEEKLREIAQKHELKLLLVFGSQASGKTHKFSDYDFGFLANAKLNYQQKSELENDLAKLVACQFVEVVDLKKASPFMLKEIIKNNQLLFEQEFEYENFFSYAVRTYLDAEKLFNLQDQLYTQTIKKYKEKIYAQ